MTGGSFEARAYLKDTRTTQTGRSLQVSEQAPMCCVLKQESGPVNPRVHVFACRVMPVL
jgi:hypothetical protein